MAPEQAAVIDVAGLRLLIDLLRADGWTVIGPTVQDGVIGQAEIQSLDDLPARCRRRAGRRVLPARERGDDAASSATCWARSRGSRCSSPPASWSAARVRATSRRAPQEHDPELRPLALFGVRSCDLHAIAVHDRVLPAEPPSTPTTPRAARQPSSSRSPAPTRRAPASARRWAPGPTRREGFDLALTELLDDRGHRFLVRAGNRTGAPPSSSCLPRQPVLGRRPSHAPPPVVETASGRMGRELDTTEIRDLLYANADHPQWDDVASRCLACSNCTLVCPTCFCTSVEDTTNLVDGTSRALAGVGLVLHQRLLPPARRQRPRARPSPATASGPPTSWPPGGTSSARRAASAAAAASPGARRRST